QQPYHRLRYHSLRLPFVLPSPPPTTGQLL
ncbi:hypothetical protein A2U01_0062299, partial [Trifolium medium]|nr:hypothetical protein [Trifolium medium]